MITANSYISGGFFRGVQALTQSSALVGRYEMSGASVDRQNAIMAGGKATIAGASPESTVFKYTGATQTLVNVAATLVTPRQSHAAFAAGNDMVVFCGGSSQSTLTLSSCEIFNTVTEAMSAGNPLTTPRRRCTGIKSSKDTGIVVGGSDSLNAFSLAAEEFNYLTKTFSNSSIIHDRTYSSISDVLGGVALVSGGEISTGMGTTAQKYLDFTLHTSVAACNATIQRSKHVSFGMLDGSAFITSGIITTSPTLTTISENHIPQLNINQVSEITFPVVGGVYGACGVQGVNLFVGGIKSDVVTVESLAAVFTETISATLPAETMIIGGSTSGLTTIKADAIKYNSLTDSYMFVAQSSQPLYYSAGCRAGDNVLKVSGLKADNSNSGAIELLNGTTNVFAVQAATVTARRAAAGCFAMGGGSFTSIISGGETAGNTKSNLVDEFNPITGVVTSVTAMTIARGYHQLSAVNHNSTDVDAVMMGGADSAGAPMASVHKREQSTRAWSTLLASITTPRSFAQGDQILNSQVIMAGGKKADNAASNYVSRFNYDSNVYTEQVGLLTATRTRGLASRTTDGNLVIMAGRNGADTANESTVESINSATFASSQKTAFPSARYGVAVGVSQLTRCSMKCNTTHVGYFTSERTTEQYNSGIASFKITHRQSQTIDIPIVGGMIYTISLAMRKNAAYTDSGVDATAPKVNLSGCGIGHKVSCTTVTSTGWTIYTVTGTATMDGVARLYITNASAQPSAVIYVDDITKV